MSAWPWLIPIAVAAVIVRGPADELSPSAPLVPVRSSSAVADDADDPAVWINRRDPTRSLVLGTNKIAAPGGALYVFDLDGAVQQVVAPLDRPNNVDVEYGMPTASGAIDIAVVTERLRRRLRVFRIDERGLAPLDGGTGVPVLDGEAGEAAMPMGISLYRRPRDGAIFAIVAPKTGGLTNYLWQYRLETDPATGRVNGRLVRRFGSFSGSGEIEAVAVDDELGYVYYADEEYALRKWHADPDHRDAGRELAVFGLTGFTQQREGLGIFRRRDGTGFLASSDQIEGATELRLYPREGTKGRPHDHGIGTAIVTSADSTDGLEIVSGGLPGDFRGGLLVMMNSRGRNFQFYRWTDVQRRLSKEAAR
ncbi:MAG: phytase [Vicinamibacterales bacterium]